jgi:hypothetical protein
VAVLPFATKRYAEGFGSPDSPARLHFLELLEGAAEVSVVAPPPATGEHMSPPKSTLSRLVTQFGIGVFIAEQLAAFRS